jgi:hypothetical protein
MKRLLINIAFILFGVGSCVITEAQEQERHEISVYTTSGLSSLRYNLNGGVRDNRFGGVAGLSYGFFFNDYWGITTGGEIAFHSTKAKMRPFSGSDFMPDKLLTYYYEVNNYYEKQKLVVVNIPIMIQYQAPLLLDDHDCYAAVGAKIGFPWKLNYKTSGATYTTSAINHNNNSIIESPENEGFGTFAEKHNKHSIDYKTSYVLSAEIGMKWSLSSRFFLYTGIYCDYGLNDIIKAKPDKSFVSYNQQSPSTIYHHSMLESVYEDGQNGKKISFTDKVTPFAVGLKIKFTFMPPAKCY